jgi:hypothetical protein
MSGISGWGTGQDIRTNFQAKVAISDFTWTVSTVSFNPLELTVCLPEPIVPGEGAVTTSTTTTLTATLS